MAFCLLSVIRKQYNYSVDQSKLLTRFRTDFTSSVRNFCRWGAEVPPGETSLAAKSEEKRLYSQITGSATAAKMSLKSEFTFFQSSSRLFQLIYFVKCRRTLIIENGWRNVTCHAIPWKCEQMFDLSYQSPEAKKDNHWFVESEKPQIKCTIKKRIGIWNKRYDSLRLWNVSTIINQSHLHCNPIWATWIILRFCETARLPLP